MAFRGAYLGVPGDMFLFAQLRGSQSVATSRETSYKKTLGGRLRAQVSPQVLREWSCEMPVSAPADSARLRALASGLYGLGPFAWVPVAATASNVLSLGASMPGHTHRTWTGNAVPTGVWRVPGVGLVRHSLIAEGSSVTFRDAPVHHEFPVTGSVYLTGGQLALEVFDAAGVPVGHGSAAAVGTDLMRVSVTLTDLPEGATSARMTVTGAQQVGLPAVSWTPKPCEWVPGAGSNSVFVEGFDADLVLVDNWQGLREAISFTVKELDSDA
ncbi:hypothetical protein [Kocuria carniphila]|uniref:hypothetical protein n=1 Tax=Kocuria carniphila TaxID=262208 RepID=UPI0034CED94B